MHRPDWDGKNNLKKTSSILEVQMFRTLFMMSLAILLTTAVPAAVEGRFMTYPDIHGDRLVFSYEGDLWTVNVENGTAVRITSHPKTEARPRFSPDGQWIAFTGEYDAGANVYLIPATGGAPARLTYRPGAQVIGWMPDGKNVVFRASWDTTFRSISKLYHVSTKGDMPQKLPVPRGVLCSFSPDGKRMVYNRRGREEYYWKGYKGGLYQDIWMANLETKQFTPITKYVGKNAYPMWIGDGMYFVSDRGKNGISNIYRTDFSTGKIQQITHYTDFDVQMPSTDGRRIVYLQAGFLNILDTENHQLRKVTVRIPTDQWRLAHRTINPKKYIQSMALSNDGEWAVFEARGDIFLVPSDDILETRNLTRSPGTRERYPQLSPDGRKVAFFSDRSGEYELYMMDIETQENNWLPLTSGLKTTVYHLEWSPDGKKILFGTKDLAIYYVEVDSKKRIKVDESRQLKNDQFTWEVSDYGWSPDSRWITYSQVEYNRNSRIYLYNLDEGKRTALTEGFYDSLNPSFDANGDYLYFLSYRNFDVQLDMFEDNHIITNPVRIMVVQLRAGESYPFEKKPKKGEKKPEKKNAEAKKQEEKGKLFRIDLKGIRDRIFPTPVACGNYFRLKAGKGKITWASTDGFSEDELEQIFTAKDSSRWTLHIFDLASEEESKVKSLITDWRLSANGEQMIVKQNQSYYLTGVNQVFSAKSLKNKLNLNNLAYTVEPRMEWEQIFNDTWRWYRDFFYDPAMHGRDWTAMGDKFRQWIPQLTSRNQLNWMLRQLVGELCVSHTYVFGGDMDPRCDIQNSVFTGLLGADFEADPSGYYRFKTIYGPTEYNRRLTAPLVKPDFPLKEGDYLIAVNGRPVRPPENINRRLQVTRDQKIELTVNSKPDPEGAISYKVTPIQSERNLRYERWIANNVRKVLDATDGQVGYLHLTAMGEGNIGQFDKYWRAFRYKKGLIIDVRGNRGGWTEYFMIDKLERRQIGYNCLRFMDPFPYPQGAGTAKYVVVSNEYNGSDGELFIDHFKARKLGTVVGVPSWGGLVGIINLEKTMDGGGVFQSNNAFYGREGKWFVENHGADPDILVENDPASILAGKDNQLETAIEETLKKIKEIPLTFPPRPAYPKK